MPVPVRILSVPYDSGQRLARMGLGPVELLDRGLANAINDAGHETAVETIDHGLPFATENAVAFAMHEKIAGAVGRTRTTGAFPLILSGNCNYAAIGAMTGLGMERAGILWFDAHGECETPETSESAFLDGMGLAMLVGACWTKRLSAVPGFTPLDPRSAVMIGARDLTEDEIDFLPRHGIERVPVETIRENGIPVLQSELDRLYRQGVERLYVHVDADVYDPVTVGHGNHYSASAGPGLFADEVVDCIEAAAKIIPVQAAAITAYDPNVDPGGRMRKTLINLAVKFAGLGSI
jgi:arginase